MKQKLLSDKKLRCLSEAFFDAATISAANDIDGVKAAFKSSNFKMVNGIIFHLNASLRKSEREFVSQCSRLLGTRFGNIGDISNLAWKSVSQSLACGEHKLDKTITFKQFVDAVVESGQRDCRFLAPNALIRFTDDVTSISIGPVEAALSTTLLVGDTGARRGKNWQIGVGKEFRTIFAGDTVVFELSPVSWAVAIKAAPGNLGEEAIWLVNVALGLLRLSWPKVAYHMCPAFSEIEGNPFTARQSRTQHLHLTEGDPSEGGTRSPAYYEIGAAVRDVVASEEFKARAEAIFVPKQKSVGERFSQGLGWMTRGRQTEDRAERMLHFFTAIEALLSADGKNAPIVQTVARHAAVILSHNAEGRAAIAADCKSLYGTRSALVHTGKRGVFTEDASKAEAYAEMLYMVVLEKVNLATPYQEFYQSLDHASFGSPWPPVDEKQKVHALSADPID
ncbi:MAG: hypothetical protein IH626_08715 [Rhodospirillales bacterium]|nr:hypothetical protein [Rhodospirillales bacterium]